MKLIDWLASEKIGHADFAADIGIQPRHLPRYLTGERIPRRTVMAKIFLITHGQVQPLDFYADAIATLRELPS